MTYFFQKFEDKKDILEEIAEEIDFVISNRKKDGFITRFGINSLNTHGETPVAKPPALLEDIKEVIESHEKRIKIQKIIKNNKGLEVRFSLVENPASDHKVQISVDTL